MKTAIFSVIAIFLFSHIGTSTAEARSRNGRIKSTQHRQMNRIRNGVQRGSVTRREGQRLMRQQRGINRTRRRALADDGRIDRREGARIRRQQTRASGQIFKQKHDRQGVQQPIGNGANKRIKRTEARQVNRIQDGLQDGSLTGKEGRRLMRQQRGINRTRRQALADDGRIDRKERARIRHKQGRANRQIYKQKHDDQTRGE